MPEATVAIVQAAPVYLNLQASLTKAIQLVETAAERGARLIVFGETWLPGYPAWLDFCSDAALWNHAPTREVFARLRQNSVVVPGPETGLLGEVASARRVTLFVGLNERVDSGRGLGTLFNSLVTIGPDGSILNHHRKLMPTYSERLVWGQGDGDGLMAVDTPVGRAGGLICWEHWMPLARQAMHDSGEHIHVAVWPTVHELHQIASRQYAFEGRCFVLAAGLIMPAADLPDELALNAPPHRAPSELVLRGGSAIIQPDGRYLMEPVFDREEILVASLDLTMIDREVMTLDVSGHYSRPDVFDFQIKRGTRGALGE